MKNLIIINISLILIYLIIPETPKPILENKEIKQDAINQKVITSNREFERKKSEEIKEISQKGIDLIKKYEGCNLTSYKLSGENIYTIGYGHYSPNNYKGQQITQEEAENLLKNDLKRFEGYVKTNCKHLNLNQNEFDALVSFTFNCGQGNLQKLIKNRTKEEIADKMLEYTKSASESNRLGLKRRRTSERNLFKGDL